MTQQEKHAAVKPLIEDRKSYGEIAVLFGASRNGVAGIVSRMRASGMLPPPNPIAAAVAQKEGGKKAFAISAEKARQSKSISAAKSRKHGGIRGGHISLAAFSKIVQKSVVAAVEAKLNPKPLVFSILELASHHCRWPIGDPREAGFGFCGADKDPLHSYCRHHRSLAYAPRERASA